MSFVMQKCEYCQREWNITGHKDNNPDSIFWGLCSTCKAILDKYRMREVDDVKTE